MTHTRRATLVVVLALLLGGCRQGDDAEPSAGATATADSATSADSSAGGDSGTVGAGEEGAPTVSAEPAGGAATASATEVGRQPEAGQGQGDGASQARADQAGTAPRQGEGQELTLEDRLDRIVAAQEAMNLRLDSLAGTSTESDSTRSLAASGEVLGAASQRVRSFGVGVVWSVVVLIVFNLLIKAVVWVLDALAEQNARRRLFYKRLVPIVRIVLWVFAAYLIVSVIFRVDAQGIFAAAAAIGVAIGFAAQDLLKNLFGGLILVFDQPFQVGDKVRVGGTYGEVVSIGLRSTRIVTADDNLVSVPNAQVVDQQVANANAGELNCQVVTDLYLPGWADEAAAKKIAFEAAASSKYVYLNKPIVVLVADEFKETFLTRVRVKAYVLDPRFEFLFHSDVTERARAGFRDVGLLRPEHTRLELVQRSAVGDETPEAVDGD